MEPKKIIRFISKFVEMGIRFYNETQLFYVFERKKKREFTVSNGVQVKRKKWHQKLLKRPEHSINSAALCDCRPHFVDTGLTAFINSLD